MKEKLTAIKKALSKKNNSRYGWIISIVALVEVAMILLVSTYAWVETISSIEITNSAGAVDTYTYTNALVGTGEGYAGQPIDLSNYFKASGNVHMASASSANGKEFFFPQVAKTGTTEPRFRKGGLNDKNTNYISFSFKVKAVNTGADFYFDKIPAFKIGDTEVKDNKVRIALTVANEDGTNSETSIYSYQNEPSESVVANVDGTMVATSPEIKPFSEYASYENPDVNTLFSLLMDQTKLVTLTAWLQDPDMTAEYAGKQLTCSNFQIVTGVKSTTINFVDRTSAFNSSDAKKTTWNWVGNDDALMWVKTSKGAFKMQKLDTAAEPTWTLTIPSDNLGSSSDDLYFYRTASTVTENPQDNYHNFWKTTLGGAGATAVPTYKAYGNLKPNSSKEGYGTWGSICEIKVLGDKAESVLPTPTVETQNTATQITLKTANDASVVPMNYNDGYWRVYIPNDDNSKDLKISFSDHTIDAVNRDTSEIGSTYRVTSAKTGYWEPASIVEVKIASGYSDMGTVSVSGGPEGATTVKVTKGTTVTLKATPNNIVGQNDKYAFEGWYEDEACTKLLSTNSEQPYKAAEKSKTYTFYAKFQFSVTLTAITDNEKENNEGGSVQINSGTAAAKVNLPVKKGGSVTLKAVQTAAQAEDYTFMGWYNSSGELATAELGETEARNATVEITNLQKPINLFAKFQVKTFVLKAYAATDSNPGEGGNATGGTVTFEPEGSASGAYAEITATNKQTITYKAVVKDREGYEFLGWYKDAACTQLHTKEATFTANKNTDPKIYYALFQLKKYNATAHAVTNGVKDNADGGTVMVKTDVGTSAAGATATHKITHGTAPTFTAAAQNGYSFVGWYDSDTFSNKVSSDLTYRPANGVGADIKVYAVFKQKFTVSLTAKTDGVVSSTGGTVQAGTKTAGATSTETVLYGDDITIKAAPSSAAYVFIDWEDANGESQGSEATKTYTNVKSNITLFANFQKKTFEIKAIAVTGGTEGSTTGGTVEFTSPIASSDATATVTVEYDGSASFKANVNVDDGYEFKGWYYKKADNTEALKSNEQEFTLENITDDTVKTYYAKFDLKQYTVTATAVTTGTATSGGGQVVQVIDGTEKTPGDTINVNGVKHGSQITLSAKPTSGATFLGWFDAETDGNQLADTKDYEFTVTAPKQVYARFKVTAITTTIYVTQRASGYVPYLWAYDKADETKNHTGGTWPGKKLSLDADTNYYKYTFTTNYTGDFYAILSNNGENKDPGGDAKGYPGVYGKTYLFKEGSMVEYNPVTVNLDAVTYSADDVKQSQGFTGGSITVGSNNYTAAKTLSYISGDKFTATAKANSGYEFIGWYTDAECSNSVGTTLSNITLDGDKTYYAKFKQKPVTNITITFIDDTTDVNDANNNKWVDKDGARLFVYDNDTGEHYEMSCSNDVWTTNSLIPSTVTNITFYRCNESGFDNGNAHEGETIKYWNKWVAPNRGNSTTYKATKDREGSWQ